LYIASSYAGSEIHVELVTANGSIVADDVSQVRLLAQEDLLYVVMTESPRGTVDLKNVRTGVGNVQQVNWLIENLPENPTALSSINVIVLTDIDTGRLSTGQKSALANWVRGGGHLVVAGGPNWQKTQAGVADLLPLQPTGNTTLTSLPSVSAFAGHTTDKLDAPSGSPIVLAQGELIANAQVLIAESNVPILTRQRVGEGVVDYLAADPGIEPFQSWNNRSDFWLTLITTVDQQPSWNNGLVNSTSAQLAANLIKGVRLPDVFQLCGFLLVYIIVIGPLNYLVLRRLGRRELAWFTIPLIILSCSVVAYVTGFSLRGTQATVNRLSLVQVWPNSTQAKVTGVLGVLAPRRGSYTIGLQNNMTLSALADYNNNPTDLGPKITQSDQYVANNVPVDAGITAVFSANGYVETKPIEGSAQIEMMLSNGGNSRAGANTPRMAGSVTNTTGQTLQDVVVLGMGGSQRLGTLQGGDSATFDFVMSPAGYQASPLTLGVSQSYSYYNASSYGTSYSQEMTIQDILGSAYRNYYGGYGSFGYGDNPEQQEIRRRQAFLRAVVQDIDASGGRGDHVYVVGWTDTSPIGVNLQGAQFLTEDTTLFVYQLPVSMKPLSGEIEVPTPFLTWTAASSSSAQTYAPYNLNVVYGTPAEFRFTPLPILNLKQITRLAVNLQGQVYSQSTISLWNWNDEQWVDVNANSPLTNITEPQRFIGPKNAIRLRVETAPGVPDVSFDRVNLAIYGILE
jgi:hypothetical protein